MISTWHQAEKFLNSFIPIGQKYTFPGKLGLTRTKYLLEQCDDPQEKLRVIHIAGTSGKGSTAAIISHALVGQGFTVGLSMSPHLLDLRERFQINNNLVTLNDVIQLVNTLQPAIHTVSQSTYGKPTYFEIITALTFLLFYKKRVDYAVIETGLGGTYDATNVVFNPNKICVITKIGHDHMEILGKTLPQIANQKAGIIHNHNKVYVIEQLRAVKDVFINQAAEMNATIEFIPALKHLLIPNSPNRPKKLKRPNSSISFSLLGDFQRENAALALATLSYMANRDDWSINYEKLRYSLQHIQIPGRMQRMAVNGKTVILDGAHNPQKMSAFIKSLTKLYPNTKFDFLIALKRGKDYRNTLKYILPKASSIIFTAFFLNKQGFPIQAEDPYRLQKLAQKMGFSSSQVIVDPHQALDHALKACNNPLIITGSFYLLSELYKHFYL